MKRVCCIILAIMMLMSLTVFAETVDETKQAKVLYKLGLFNGTGTDENGEPGAERINNFNNALRRDKNVWI